MKLTKYIKTAAALLVAATALSGCKFEGTKTDFKDYEYNAYAVTGTTVGQPASITFYTTSIPKATAKTEISFTINSRAALDEKSIDAAVNAYIVDNASANYLPYARGAVLPKTLRRIAYTYNTGSIDATVYYYIDASSVTKNKIALVVDATKLKEKTGKLVLNNNNNEKCGEESDSVIVYPTVAAKADGSAPDTLTTGHGESYNTTFSLSYSSSFETNSEGNHTGVIKYTVGAPYTTGADGTVYGDGFAADLGKMYTFLSFPIGAKEWKKDSLTWEYDSTNKEYVAKSPAIEYGTQYRILTKQNNSLEFAAASTYWGHPVRRSWKANKDSWSDPDTYKYATTEPAYIYNTPDNNESITTPTTWSETQITIDDSQNDFDTQNSLIKVEIYNNNKVIFKLADTYTSDTYNLRFGATDGFIITDAKGNMLKTKKPVVYDEDDKGVKAVIVEVDNAYTKLNTSNFKFWVGEKTTLKANAQYTNQLKFGCPAVATEYGPAGYVRLTNWANIS